MNTVELGLPSQSDPLVMGSLNLRTICRLVVYLYTFCSDSAADFPAHLGGSGFRFVSFRLVLSLLALVITYDGEMMSSMWIHES